MSNSETSKPADISWFTRSAARYTPLMLELLLIAIVIRLIGLIEPFVFQTLIDRILPFQRTASLNLILIVLATSTFFSAVLGYLSSLLSTHISNRLTHKFGSRIFFHSLGLPTRFLQRFQVGELLTRMSEIDTVKTFMTSTMSDLVLDVLFAIVYVFALYSLSPMLTFILLIMLPLQMISFAAFGPFIRRRMQASFSATSAQESLLVEAFANPITLKSLSSEKIHGERLTRALGNSLDAHWHVTKILSASEALSQLLRGVSVVLIIYYGSGLVFEGKLSFGQLVAFHLLSQNVAGPILSLSKIWEKWQELRLARLRLGDLLNQEVETINELPVIQSFSNAALETNHLTFSYDDGDPILHDLSLHFPPQLTTVITGDSGCGKSTLAKLLCGLYQPNYGEVILAGQNIAKHDPVSVRQRIAYVAQEPVLFNGSIRENLLIAAPSASPADIEAALRHSEAWLFIDKFPLGIDTQVGERGSFLSGGQRQRIAIARSLLTNPDVLVLDEPTSSLDEEMSQKIINVLASMTPAKTIVIITHRPDLLRGKVNLIDLNRRSGKNNV